MHTIGHDVRIRFTTAFEWAVAALFLCATVLVGSLIVKALYVPVRPVTQLLLPVDPPRPPGIPAGAAYVSELPLPGGHVLRPGATLASTAAVLGRSAETGRLDVDPGPLGERLTRFYEVEGARFALVFEPLERNDEPRLVAIYLMR